MLEEERKKNHCMDSFTNIYNFVDYNNYFRNEE